MDDDQLADTLAPLIAEAHLRVQQHPQLSERVKRKARLLHALAEELRDDLRSSGTIHIESGGDPKGPGE